MPMDEPPSVAQATCDGCGEQQLSQVERDIVTGDNDGESVIARTARCGACGNTAWIEVSADGTNAVAGASHGDASWVDTEDES
jgi:hypothetical protein